MVATGVSALEVFFFFSETNYCCEHISIRHTQKGSGLILLDEVRQNQKTEFPRRFMAWFFSQHNNWVVLVTFFYFLFFLSCKTLFQSRVLGQIKSNYQKPCDYLLYTYAYMEHVHLMFTYMSQESFFNLFHSPPYSPYVIPKKDATLQIILCSCKQRGTWESVL